MVHAERLPGGGWEILDQAGDTRRFDLLVVGNGHHWDPRIADFPGDLHRRDDPLAPLHRPVDAAAT